MDKSFGLFFHLKKENRKDNPRFKVYMRITVDGKLCEISTKRRCNPDNWNVSAGRLQGKSEAVREFNSYLDTLQQKVFEAKRKIIEMDKELTAESIKNELLGKNNKQKHMLLEVFKYPQSTNGHITNWKNYPARDFQLKDWK